MEIKLGLVESRFADIIWQNAPITTKELVAACEKELNWKRTTTYTVLKKLCERGLFQNNGGLVTVCMTKEEFAAGQSERIVDESYDGSLPAFVAAFTKRRRLSADEIEAIRRMIEMSGEGD